MRSRTYLKGWKVAGRIARSFGILLAVLVVAAGCDSGGDPVTDDPVDDPPEQSLRALADQRGLSIGAAVDRAVLDDPQASELMAAEFNMLTPENAMKWQSTQPQRDQFTFDLSDALVQYARENGMKVRGHTLIWHNQLPSWVSFGTWSRDQLLEVMEEHIDAVAGRYAGQIDSWDVVNEAIEGDGSYRISVFQEVIGEEFIEQAFRMANAADPNARLFYNDYGAEGMNTKSDAIYEMVRDFKQRGVPIHGVGLQMHFSTEWSPSRQEVATNMERLADLGLEVQVTELDVRIPLPVTDLLLTQQASVYADMLGACLDAVNCNTFVLWGLTDRYSWISSHFPGYGAALLFDEDYQPKTAYIAVRDVLK